MAGNQLGKTVAGSFEAAIHATGRYPAWWEGRRFAKPTILWCAGVTGESTRDNVQRLLMGRPGQFGTGSIPAECIIDHTASRGVADLLDTIRVRHATGGESVIALKTYEKGREKWQGETLDGLWFDEEPPLDVYSEGLTRTQATGGLVWVTFTPLLGMSDVVVRFLMEESKSRHVTKMEIGDAPHYTAEQIAEIVAGYPEHEREARAKGIPVLGSGRVYPVTEESIRWTAHDIPRHWHRIAGIDFGWDHPTAAVWLAWDKDRDTIHVYDCYRVKEQTPAIHAAAIRARGAWMPVAWPHDGLQRDKMSGETLAQSYRDQGLNFCHERAQFPDGQSGVEAGLMDILDRMKTGRFKVAEHLADWWEEFRMYHRKDGLIVKERDDIMDAMRYAVMMLRFSTQDQGSWSKPLNVNSKWVV